MSDPSPAFAARRTRIARIRRRVIGGASGLFLLSTGAIVVQLVTGHDPALARAAAARSVANRPATPFASGSALPSGQAGGTGYGPRGGWDHHRGAGPYGGGGGGSFGGGGAAGAAAPGGSAPGGAAPGGGSDDQPPSQVAPLTTHQS